MAKIIEFPKPSKDVDDFTNAMLMLKEMDFEDFKSHVCFTLDRLLTDVTILQNLAFLLSIMVANLRGKPLSIEDKREIAQDLRVDLAEIG